MVSHVKLGHPLHIMCWVCGTSWSSLQGQVSLLHCLLEQFPVKKGRIGTLSDIFYCRRDVTFLGFLALLVFSLYITVKNIGSP
jgi:hypothetical protein